MSEENISGKVTELINDGATAATAGMKLMAEIPTAVALFESGNLIGTIGVAQGIISDLGNFYTNAEKTFSALKDTADVLANSEQVKDIATTAQKLKGSLTSIFDNSDGTQWYEDVQNSLTNIAGIAGKVCELVSEIGKGIAASPEAKTIEGVIPEGILDAARNIGKGITDANIKGAEKMSSDKKDHNVGLGG